MSLSSTAHLEQRLKDIQASLPDTQDAKDRLDNDRKILYLREDLPDAQETQEDLPDAQETQENLPDAQETQNQIDDERKILSNQLSDFKENKTESKSSIRPKKTAQKGKKRKKPTVEDANDGEEETPRTPPIKRTTLSAQNDPKPIFIRLPSSTAIKTKLQEDPKKIEINKIAFNTLVASLKTQIDEKKPMNNDKVQTLYKDFCDALKLPYTEEEEKKPSKFESLATNAKASFRQRFRRKRLAIKSSTEEALANSLLKLGTVVSVRPSSLLEPALEVKEEETYHPFKFRYIKMPSQRDILNKLKTDTGPKVWVNQKAFKLLVSLIEMDFNTRNQQCIIFSNGLGLPFKERHPKPPTAEYSELTKEAKKAYHQSLVRERKKITCQNLKTLATCLEETAILAPTITHSPAATSSSSLWTSSSSMSSSSSSLSSSSSSSSHLSSLLKS